jgi:hypothetical protein
LDKADRYEEFLQLKKPISSESLFDAPSNDRGKLPLQGQKLIVTDYSLAHWIAQTYNLDINDLPKIKPDHLSKETYDLLKGKILKDYMAWDKSLMKPEQVFVNSIKSGTIQTKQLKSKKSTEDLDGNWMRDPFKLQPLIYALSKTVQPF